VLAPAGAGVEPRFREPCQQYLAELAVDPLRAERRSRVSSSHRDRSSDARVVGAMTTMRRGSSRWAKSFPATEPE
jgi:hypothetical protein